MQCVIYYDYCNVIIISLSRSVTASAEHVLKRFLFKAIFPFFLCWDCWLAKRFLLWRFNHRFTNGMCAWGLQQFTIFLLFKMPSNHIIIIAEKRHLQVKNLSKKSYFRFLIERIASLIKVRKVYAREWRALVNLNILPSPHFSLKPQSNQQPKS